MILPDDVFTQLQHLLDTEHTAQWTVGDFICDVWAEVQTRYPDGHADMITQLASKTGADKSTLRSREKMSGFYSQADREDWIPPLSYHHLRAQLPTGDDWRLYADWTLVNGKGGGVATVGELREHLKSLRDKDQVLRDRITRLLAGTQRLIDMEDTPNEVREMLMICKLQFEDMLDI